MKTFNEQEWLEYRAKYPELRFWQALRGYMEVGYICAGELPNELKDTFYIKDK